MNRETEMHFGNVPKIQTRRSAFNMSHSHKTTFNTGQIIPILVDADITPGDTVSMDVAEVVRMATPIYPVMDNMYMDIMAYFVPHRLVDDHWEEFWGENDDPWARTIEYEIPQITAPSGGWASKTIADYMGVPTYVDNLSINALPFRAYTKVYNDWFRDENLQYSAHLYKDDTTRTGSNGTTLITDIELGGMPAVAAKLADRFTKALPAPQKGPAVTVPLGSTAQIKDKATTRAFVMSDSGNNIYTNPKLVADISTTQIMASGSSNSQIQAYKNDSVHGSLPIDTRIRVNTDELYTDLSNATASTINQLRTAFAIQKWYEAQARLGSRYVEVLRGIFDVTPSDGRLQRSEYLGGQRVPINMEQIIQNSSTDTVSPQGNASGFSVTVHSEDLFTKSFEEHGTLLVVAVCRTEHTYQQGLHPMWSRKKQTDFYNPFFANLSEQPVYNREIYAQGTNTDKQVFGYQEAWSEYRYKENRVSGEMRSNTPGGGLDAWHYADDYSALPTLGSAWITEPTANVDRTIAVSADLAHQFIGDFYFKAKYVRNMPVYSVPGLIDHV